MASNESFLTLRDILKVLFKRKALIITVTLVATVTATVVVLLKPPVYESVAQILVRRSIPELEEPSANPGERGSQTFFRQINQADEMNTAISVLKSRDLVESVMNQLQLTPEQFDKVPDFRRYVRIAWNGCRGRWPVLRSVPLSESAACCENAVRDVKPAVLPPDE